MEIYRYIEREIYYLFHFYNELIKCRGLLLPQTEPAEPIHNDFIYK